MMEIGPVCNRFPSLSTIQLQNGGSALDENCGAFSNRVIIVQTNRISVNFHQLLEKQIVSWALREKEREREREKGGKTCHLPSFLRFVDILIDEFVTTSMSWLKMKWQRSSGNNQPVNNNNSTIVIAAICIVAGSISTFEPFRLGYGFEMKMKNCVKTPRKSSHATECKSFQINVELNPENMEWISRGRFFAVAVGNKSRAH